MTDPLKIPAHLQKLGKSCGLRAWSSRKSTNPGGYFESLDSAVDMFENRTGSKPSSMYLSRQLAILLDEEGALLEFILKKNAVDIADADSWSNICLVAAMILVQAWEKKDDGGNG